MTPPTRVLPFPAGAKMTEAKLSQALALIHDLTRVVRELSPGHPVLESVFLTSMRID